MIGKKMSENGNINKNKKFVMHDISTVFSNDISRDSVLSSIEVKVEVIIDTMKLIITVTTITISVLIFCSDL